MAAHCVARLLLVLVVPGAGCSAPCVFTLHPPRPALTDPELTFRHADGRLYGEPVCARAADVWSQAFRALRGMGFSERETRGALEKTRSASTEVRRKALAATGVSTEIQREALGDRGAGTHELPSVEHVLRKALAVLTETREATRPARSSGFAPGPE